MTHVLPQFHGRAFAALIFGASAIGFAPIFMRLSPLGPTATAFWRLGLAMPLLWTIFLWPTPGDRANRPDWTKWHWLLLPGVLFTCDLAVWHWAVNLTSVSNSTILANAAPIFVTFWAWLLIKEKITVPYLGVLAAANLCTVFLIGGNLQLSKETLLGDALSILTAMFYGSYQLSIKNARAHFPTVTIMAVCGLISCVLLGVIAAVSGETFFWGPDTAPQWPGLAAGACAPVPRGRAGLHRVCAGPSTGAFFFRHAVNPADHRVHNCLDSFRGGAGPLAVVWWNCYS